jgi:hypothetical protein
MIIPTIFSNRSKEQWSGVSYYDFDGKQHAIGNIAALVEMAKQIKPYYDDFEGSIKIVLNNVNRRQFYYFVNFMSRELSDIEWIIKSNGNNMFTIYPML